MPQLKVKVRDRHKTFAPNGGIAKRVDRLVRDEATARTQAARTATTATRAAVKYKRDVISPRPGRSSTGGKMKNHLKWTSNNGEVQFDIQRADAKAPHWIIQEIGTNARATLRRGGQKNPQGRPKKGATYVRTVKSQKGRRIRGGLVFASGGNYSPTGSRRDEQIHWASKTLGVPARPAAIRISREIDAQSFVKEGGEQGFRQYKQSVLAAARQSFKKSNRP